jgi:hypothetical protein
VKDYFAATLMHAGSAIEHANSGPVVGDFNPEGEMFFEEMLFQERTPSGLVAGNRAHR